MTSSQSGSGSPELTVIPTPDYGSSPDEEREKSHNPRTKTFNKRHPPHVDIFESFNPIGKLLE